MNIRELEEATGQPARLIRFLISEEVLPPPDGERRWATYGDHHVEAMRRYADLKARGVTSLDHIRAEMASARATEAGPSEKGPKPQAVILRPVEGMELRIESGAMERLDVDAVIERIRADLDALRAPSGGNEE